MIDSQSILFEMNSIILKALIFGQINQRWDGIEWNGMECAGGQRWVSVGQLKVH